MNSIVNADLSDRRDFLKATGAALAAASIPSLAAATPENTQQVFYAHGMAWNTELPEVLGELRLTFDIAVRLGGTGLGTFGDDVHPEFNAHFAINSTARHGNVYTLEGEVVAARDPSLVGMPITVLAEVEGSATGVTIMLGENTFKGAGLVVIAIIAILIGLLLPPH
ncbi:MAG TPA: twin-arginine translocation signal domain-containing protein [Blastocatellia bacterium]|nr:twin-arginine translocation signal domain-containing protein [Blastocatellia bacterium]